MDPASRRDRPNRDGGIEVMRAVAPWLSDGQARGWSERTVDNRRRIGHKLEWWLVHEEKLPATLDQLDPDRLRRFFQYCRTANPAGRFGCTAPNARQQWWQAGSAVFPVEEPLEVGLHAIGKIVRSYYPGAHRQGTAIRFERFELWR